MFTSMPCNRASGRQQHAGEPLTPHDECGALGGGRQLLQVAQDRVLLPAELGLLRKLGVGTQHVWAAPVAGTQATWVDTGMQRKVPAGMYALEPDARATSDPLPLQLRITPLQHACSTRAPRRSPWPG